jgi:hypothetical protein
MPHDELLMRLWEKRNSLCDNLDVHFALSAVVELHKPGLIPDWVPTKEKLICWCAHIYPCPTIQAIEEKIIG